MIFVTVNMSLFLVDFLTFIFLLEEGITVDVLYPVCVVGAGGSAVEPELDCCVAGISKTI